MGGLGKITQFPPTVALLLFKTPIALLVSNLIAIVGSCAVEVNGALLVEM
jgi:hypothetical protein